MKFTPGVSGNPSGGRKEKPFRDALMLAIKREIRDAEGDRTALQEVANKLVNVAMTGDTTAIREVADRIDGKVPQAQIHTGDEDGGAVNIAQAVTVTYVRPDPSGS